MGQRPHSARRVSLLNSIIHELQKLFNNNGFAARVSVAERILGLRATLRAANTDLEHRACERAAELETARGDSSPASFVAKKQPQ